MVWHAARMFRLTGERAANSVMRDPQDRNGAIGKKPGGPLSAALDKPYSLLMSLSLALALSGGFGLGLYLLLSIAFKLSPPGQHAGAHPGAWSGTGAGLRHDVHHGGGCPDHPAFSLVITGSSSSGLARGFDARLGCRLACIESADSRHRCLATPDSSSELC